MDFFTFAWISDPSIWLSLATLTGLEIVLGIDNLVFIAILANRLPEARRAFAPGPPDRQVVLDRPHRPVRRPLRHAHEALVLALIAAFSRPSRPKRRPSPP